MSVSFKKALTLLLLSEMSGRVLLSDFSKKSFNEIV